MIVVHVTHEAVDKIGGIGTVMAGLMTADAYDQAVSRTILVGPLLSTDRPVNRRLGDGGQVTYSSVDAVDSHPWRERFHPIERTYDVGIIYGTRAVTDACSGKTVSAEALVLDVFHANEKRLNLFKAELFQKFGVPSDRFESAWEFEQYVRLAEPAFEALKAIGCDGEDEQVILLAHEYMGMPTALKAVLDGSPNIRTVFYAHEVASVRPIVEDMPGHDTMFYNVMSQAETNGHCLDELFPSVGENFKHPLVKAARYCDHVFAVGDLVQDELRFLDPHFRTMEIDLVYNGIPAFALTLEQKLASRQRMRDYSSGLFGPEPTWTFSHVARPVLSKGIWRDIRVLGEMDALLSRRGESAVYYLLGTLAGQRRPQAVRQMERVYGWPVAHEKGYPDLSGGEEGLDDMLIEFNRNHQAVRAVLVNQWDWSRKLCGERMPEEMTFRDIRCGTDVEFGLSVYEPFGISQLEPLSFGAICVVSNVCGCLGFARSVAGDEPLEPNIIEADFLRLDEDMSIEQLIDIDIGHRDRIEIGEARRLAELIVGCLPRDEESLRERIRSGYNLAIKMSWEQVVQGYFLPSLGRVASAM